MKMDTFFTKIKKITIFLVISFLVLPNLIFALSNETNSANNGAPFDPSYIISDATFTNWQTMTQSEIEDFLSRQKGALANYRTTDIDGKEKSAGQIIFEASQRHKINPQVLITLIQKEQTLITQQAQKSSQFDWATGFACPDGRGPIEKFKGFARQIDRAAWRLRYYLEYPWEFPIGKGRTAYIDKTYLTPKNAATAALYNYTPHIKGNKLFWSIFQKWFSEEHIFKEGSLLRAEGEPGIWLIKNEERHGFPSKTIFLLGYRFDDVHTVSYKVLEEYPVGEPMKFPNFSLLKTPEGKIYLIDNEKKREISEEMFRQIGFHPEEIIKLNGEDLNLLALYEEGEPVKSPWINEVLLQDKETFGVWLVKNNTRRAIIDKTILEANYPYQKIIKVNPQELEKFEIGAPLKLQDGVLIKSVDNPTVYVIGQEKRMPIADPETFEALGYSWQAVITVPQKVIDIHPLGETLYLN